MFSAAEIRGDHKQVESGETENTSDQLETVVVIVPGIILGLRTYYKKT